MHIEFFTDFNKGDNVFNDEYGKGVVTGISVRCLILPSDEKDKEVTYFVRFADCEELVDQKHLQVTTDS